jgi:large subunit ribosomal protein L35
VLNALLSGISRLELHLDLVLGICSFRRGSVLPPTRGREETVVNGSVATMFAAVMPKSIARSKTRKAVAKRFKITARGKILRAQSSRRHLLSSKRAKRKRQLGKAARVDKTDEARIKANLPFA